MFKRKLIMALYAMFKRKLTLLLIVPTTKFSSA
jgi:hypothetical protein